MLVLPVDPDASAARLRDDLRARAGVDVGVIVSDTFGRPWRTGQTDVALGVAGVPALRSEIGARDLYGRALDVTEAAVADELAGAADLVRRKADGIPVVVVRGFDHAPDEAAEGRDLIRPAETDLFRHGRGGLAAAMVGDPAVFVGPVDQRDLWQAQATVEAVCGSRVRMRARRARDGRAGSEVAVTAETPGAAGAGAGVLLAVLIDLGYGATLVEVTDAPTVWAGRPAAVARPN